MFHKILLQTSLKSFFIVILILFTLMTLPSNAFSQDSIRLNENKQIEQSCELTPSTVQGPYYKENSPFKQDLAKGIEGDKLVVSGKVMNFNCEPIKGAILDFWQADSQGEYDNINFNLRGKVISDVNGNYTLNTIFPGSYSDGNLVRPAHIHVKAWIPENPGNPSLVTQLYFKGDPNMDQFVKEPLIIKINEKNGTKYANFDFVLEDYRGFGN